MQILCVDLCRELEEVFDKKVQRWLKFCMSLGHLFSVFLLKNLFEVVFSFHLRIYIFVKCGIKNTPKDGDGLWGARSTMTISCKEGFSQCVFNSLILFRRWDFLWLCLLEGDRNKYCLLAKDKKKVLEVNQKET